MGAEIVERHLIGGLLRAGGVAYTAPLQGRPLAVVREVDGVKPVVGEAYEVVTGVEGRVALLRQIRIGRVTDFEAEMTLFALHAAANLSPVAKLMPEIQSIVEPVYAVLRQQVLSLQHVHVATLVRRMRHDEPAGKLRQRQEQLGRNLGDGADLQVGDPFAGIAGDIRHDKAYGGVISGVALEVVLQAEPETQVVRTLGIRARIERQPVAALVPDHVVVERIEAASPIERGHAARDRIRIERFAGQVVEQTIRGGAIALRSRIHAHEVDARRRSAWRLTTLHVALHVLLAHAERRQLLGLAARRGLAHADHARHDAEVE